MVYFIDSLALFTISIVSFVAPCIQASDVDNKMKIAKLASTYHAAMVSLMGILVVLDEDLPRSLYWYSIGYFLSDIWYEIYINMIRSKRLSTYIIFIIHHLVMLLYEGYSIVYNPSDELAFYFMNRVFLSEIAVVPLNVLWYLRKYDPGNKRGLMVTASVLVVSYFFSRVVNLSILFVEVFYSPIRYVGVWGFPLLIANYVWFYKIIQGCWSNLRVKKE